MTSLTTAAAQLSAAYNRYLADPAALPEFLEAGEAYHAALKAQAWPWQKLVSGAFMVPKTQPTRTGGAI